MPPPYIWRESLAGAGVPCGEPCGEPTRERPRAPPRTARPAIPICPPATSRNARDRAGPGPSCRASSLILILIRKHKRKSSEAASRAARSGLLGTRKVGSGAEPWAGETRAQSRTRPGRGPCLGAVVPQWRPCGARVRAYSYTIRQLSCVLYTVHSLSVTVSTVRQPCAWRVARAERTSRRAAAPAGVEPRPRERYFAD